MGAETAVLRDCQSSPRDESGVRASLGSDENGEQWLDLGCIVKIEKNPLLTNGLWCRGETKRRMHCDV